MNPRCHPFLRFCLILLLLCGSTPVLAAICRVAPAGAGDGSDWSQPASLQGALATSTCTDIWVAQGTYTPDGGSGDRNAHFAITRELRLIGGFAGYETSIEERASSDPTLTVLSGEIGDPDDDADNSHRIVLLDASQRLGGFTAATVIDGFTLRGARSANNYPDHMGAALFCFSDRANRPCSPQLKRLHFIDNHALHGGALGLRTECCLAPIGGVVAMTISDSVFTGNRAQLNGGAIYARTSSSPSRIELVIERSTFADNTAHFDQEIGPGGGAIYVDAGSQGGVIDLFIQNSTFTGNSVQGYYGRGGAIYNRGVGGPSNVRLDQVTFSGNTATFAGSLDYASQAIYTMGSRATTLVERSIVADAAPFVAGTVAPDIVLNQTVVPVGAPCPAYATCTDTIEGDPLLGPLQQAIGSTPTLLPGTAGVAIDAVDCGDAATDQRGVERPQGLRCDAGAVEQRVRVLTLELEGDGSIAVWQAEEGSRADCDSADAPCTYVLGEHDAPAPVITLSLTAAAGWSFGHWDGDCSAVPGSPLQAQLTLDGNRSCTAHLVPPAHVITLLTDPAGMGSIQLPAGTDPDAVPQGTVLELLATPAPGWDVADPTLYPPLLDCGSAQDIQPQADGSLRFSTPPIMQDCTITARFANQPPGFTASGSEVVAVVNSAPTSFAQWATGIRSGITEDPDQSVQFQLTLVETLPAGAQLFAPGGEPVVEADGTLHFTPGTDPGSALFQVRLRDDAGSANGGNDTSAPVMLLVRLVLASTDLSVHAEVPDTFNFPGDQVAFALRVENGGPHDAQQARVQWNPPPELSGIEWICEPQGSASCAATGSGGIDEPIDIPANGSLGYLIQATLPAPAPQLIENHASVSPGPDQADPDPGDDSVIWQLRVDGLLRDGFEHDMP